MEQVSTTVAAVRDAFRRHPWWADSLLALFLTVIALGAAIAGHNAHEPHASLVTVVIAPFTTLPIAFRRYRPLEVLAVTVVAETALLISSSQAEVPLGVVVALYTVASRCERPVSIRAAEWTVPPRGSPYRSRSARSSTTGPTSGV